MPQRFQTDFIEYSKETVPPGMPRAIRTSYVQEFAKQEIKMLCTFTDKEIKLTSYNGEQQHDSVAPLDDQEWVARLQSRRRFKAACLDGKDSVEYRTVRPELGPKVVTVTSTKVAEETIVVQGDEWPVSVRGPTRLPWCGKGVIGCSAMRRAGLGRFH